MSFALARYIAGAYSVRDRLVLRYGGKQRVISVLVPRRVPCRSTFAKAA